MTLSNGRVQHFYDIGHTKQPLSHEALKSELIAQLRLGMNDGLHQPTGGASRHMIVTHGPVDDSGWVFVFYTEPGEFFARARLQAIYAALTVLALALIGIVLTSRIIQPLVRRISIETRNLQRLLRRNQELLDTVQANEAKLQAVIDNFSRKILAWRTPPRRCRTVTGRSSAVALLTSTCACGTQTRLPSESRTVHRATEATSPGPTTGWWMTPA